MNLKQRAAQPARRVALGWTGDWHRRLRSSVRPASVTSIVVLLLSASACSHDYSGTVKSLNVSNIQRLSNFYAGFQSSRMGQGPKDETELKTFIQAQTPETLKLMGIDPTNRDAIWISERDHKPFKVRYGVQSPFGAVAAVVFEQDGVGGKRQVGFNNSKVEETDESRYKDLWEGRGVAKPPPIGVPPPGSAEAGKSN